MLLLSLFCVVIAGLHAQVPSNRYLDINPKNEAPGSVTSMRTAPQKDFAATLVSKIAEEVAQEEKVEEWIGEGRLFLIVFREKVDDPFQIRGIYFKQLGRSWFMIEFTETSRDPASATREVIRKLKGTPQKSTPLVPSKTSA